MAGRVEVGVNQGRLAGGPPRGCKVNIHLGQVNEVKVRPLALLF